MDHRHWTKLHDKIAIGLMKKAIIKHGENISPCKSTFARSITIEGGRDALLWYNTPDRSTHIVHAEIEDLLK